MAQKAFAFSQRFASQCTTCLFSVRPHIKSRPRIPKTRRLTTSTQRKAFAAPPIDFSDPSKLPPPSIEHARIVPASPSYFTGLPSFTDDLLHLSALAKKYSALPTVSSADVKRVAWRTLPDYRIQVGEPITAARYRKIVAILKQLNKIYPPMMPREVAEALAQYDRGLGPNVGKSKPQVVDEDGRAFGKGGRKTSSARVYLVEGQGEVLVNGNRLHEHFQRVHDRESAIWALKATGRMDKYNVWALVKGGGTTGQAESLTLAVAKALLVHEPALKPALRRAGCVTRDPRKVERKKPGHVKARKMPAWVKR
ncbi:37S ribosomal protein S9, mitochondrial [Agyrium rufum]|nr:37S ribosomal protein S9, mitochondrial [Agyrium rufum]